MLRLLSTLLFCSISISGFSQEKTIWLDYPNLGIMQYSVILEDDLQRSNNYLNHQFEPSKLITTENTVLSAIKIRYNVKEDVMECKIGSQHCIIKSPKKLKEINIKGDCFEYKKFLVKKDTTNGYLQRLYRGGQNIYVKHYLSSIKDNTDRSKLKSYYLIQNKGELPVKSNSVNGLLSQIFEDFIDQAREFEKKNQLNLNSPKDLQTLLAYLDHLSKDIVSSR